MKDAPPMFPLASRTLYVTLAGSQAHGTAREGSDVDLRGVCIAPLSIRLSLFRTFEQHEGPLDADLLAPILPRLQAHPTASRALDIKMESVIFDLSKFIGLCSLANPNALEILFADERDWVFETPLWRKLHAERHRFLTKKVQQTFHGYAMAQLKKIKTHRSWLLDPPKSKPSREDYGLPIGNSTSSRDDQNRIEQSIAETIRSYGIDNIDMPKATRIAIDERLEAFYRDALAASEADMEERMRAVATLALHLPPDVVVTLNAEKRYRAAQKHWESYQAWKAERNRARAELEAKHGYDTKHAMHLVRLMRMAIEILERGELNVRRPDFAELHAIRDGAWPFDALLEQTESLRLRMDEAASRSFLPADVDRPAIDALALEMLTDPGFSG